MGIESANGIWDLNELWPLNTDDRSTSSAHHRLIKSAIRKTLPNVSATIAVSAAEINFLSGADQNIQDALDAYSLSLSSVNAQLDLASASFASINSSLDAHSDSISALNTVADLVNETYHCVIELSATALLIPPGWTSSRSVSGVYVITHNLSIGSPYASAQYLITGRIAWGTVASAGPNSVKIHMQDNTSLRYSKFFLEMKLIGA